MLPNVKKILVTSALPYANGPIHLGHLVEYIQTDVWVRFQRLIGNEVVYICADDTHGTPIMLKAEKEKIDPETLISRVWIEHKKDFSYFNISFDNYYSTHSKENKLLSEYFYKKLKELDLIKIKNIEQMYDEEKKLFLPDRFIVGICPKCKSEDQYGDSCEKCGATYSPTELINPKSALSGKKPIKMKSDHHFFTLSDKRCVDFLKEWLRDSTKLQVEALNKVNEWLELDIEGKSKLVDWDISRDAPYFGFLIPETSDKYFYVWLDAPIGYYAGLMDWCNKNDKDFNEYVSPNSKIEQIHFIGKDILYFHSLFWPAMCHFSGFRTPTSIFTHGFLTINGKKMSKSKGTFITAGDYIDSNINPEFLRYYLSSKLNGSMEDLDLNLSEFAQKINVDLVGKYINILSRCSGFIHKFFESSLMTTEEINKLCGKKNYLENFIDNKIDLIFNAYLSRNTSKVLRELIYLTDKVNSFIHENKPWEISKNLSPSNKKELKNLHLILSISIRCFAKLTIMLKPVLPELCKKIEKDVFKTEKPWQWKDVGNVKINKLGKVKHLITRIQDQDLKNLTPEKENV